MLCFDVIDQKVSEIAVIRGELEEAVRARMTDAFFWGAACSQYPELSAEEIASMAASTYEHVDVPYTTT